MNQQPLRQLFGAMYHEKFRFEEFLELVPEEHRTRVHWKGRLIYKPSKRLRAFHSFLNLFLVEHLPTNSSASFAYRKGASLLNAVAPHVKNRAFYQTDFAKFFESITSELVRSVIYAAPTPILDLEDHLDRILSILTVDNCLPIGYSTSPPLSNACLFGFDARMEKASAEKGWIYTRYADDIIISGASREAIGDADEVIRNCIAVELGDNFSLNEKKSKLTTKGRKIKILGLLILPNETIAIDRDVRFKIESYIYFYIKDRARLAKIFEEERGEDFEEGLQRLSGLVSYAAAIDEKYLERLRVKFGTTVIDSLLHRSAK